MERSKLQNINSANPEIKHFKAHTTLEETPEHSAIL
jgi:hypothetical protein